jgi:hypothetical protein
MDGVKLLTRALVCLGVIVFVRPCGRAATVSQIQTEANGKKVLYVDRRPFQIYGIQIRVDNDRMYAGLSNSQMSQYFLWAKKLNANTVEIPILWSDCEPSDNRWDWTNVDWAISQAGKYGLKIEILWFGTNVTGGAWSKFVPGYIPTYHLANGLYTYELDAQGNHVDAGISDGDGHKITLSADDVNTQWYENRAVTNLMNHLAALDTSHVVIGVQVEDEPTIVQFTNRNGTIGPEVDRDHSPVENTIYDGLQNPLDFSKDRLALYLDRVAGWVKNSPQPMIARANFMNIYNYIDEDVSRMRFWSSSVDFTGYDTYGIDQWTLYQRDKGDFSASGNIPFLAEQEGWAQDSRQKIIDVLAANGSGASMYRLERSVASTDNFLLNYDGSDYAGAPTNDIRQLYALLNKAMYYLAIRQNGSSTNEVQYFNAGGSTATQYDYAMTVGPRHVEYWTANGGMGIAMVNAPGQSTDMTVMSSHDGSFTICCGTPSKVELGYYDKNGWFYRMTDQYHSTADMPLVNKGNGTYQVWLYSGEVVKWQW